MALPPTVKSIVLTKTGDFDAISQIEVPFPTQGKNEILVRVVLIPYAEHVDRGGPVPRFIMVA